MAILAILVRHAKPLLNGTTQTLSESGRMMQDKVNATLLEMAITPNEIWTSPILRAKETAIMIGKVFNIEPIEEYALSELDMFDEMEITNRLAQMPDESTVILVSHGPQIMRLCTYWMGSQFFMGSPPTSSASFIEFKEKPQAGRGTFIRMVTYSDL